MLMLCSFCCCCCSCVIIFDKHITLRGNDIQKQKHKHTHTQHALEQQQIVNCWIWRTADRLSGTALPPNCARSTLLALCAWAAFPGGKRMVFQTRLVGQSHSHGHGSARRAIRTHPRVARIKTVGKLIRIVRGTLHLSTKKRCVKKTVTALEI